MKRLIEQFQSEYYRGAAAPAPRRRPAGADARSLTSDKRPRRRAGPSRAEIETRFHALVQSPLRAGLLRFLCARPDEAFDVEALMQTFGRMRLDIENCLRELVTFGVAQQGRRRPGRRATRSAAARAADALRDLLDEFLERRATVSHEDRSPSVQRFREMIGRDEKMLVVFEWIRTAAKSDISVLILGPTGSGKEVVARMIHELSRRGTQQVPGGQLRGAARHPVRVGDLRLREGGVHRRARPQAGSARTGQQRHAVPRRDRRHVAHRARPSCCASSRSGASSGSAATIRSTSNFRLISATNRPLDQFVRDSRFREDLYYRVNAFSIRLPSLRERASDIPVLAQRFLARYCAANGLPLDGKNFSKEATDLLLQYHWPGNIRELESTVVAGGAVLARARHPRQPTSSSCTPARPRPTRRDERLPSLAEAERAHIVRVLEAVHWNKKQAAAVLEISRGTLYRKIVEYGLENDQRPAKAAPRPATD